MQKAFDQYSLISFLWAVSIFKQRLCNGSSNCIDARVVYLMLVHLLIWSAMDILLLKNEVGGGTLTAVHEYIIAHQKDVVYIM